VEQATRTIERGLNQTSRVALGRLGMPTRRDVADLTARVEQLTVKVDTLARKRRVRVTRAKKGGRHGR
jgi:hypothetical protein